jgi:hypothetical protein
MGDIRFANIPGSCPGVWASSAIATWSGPRAKRGKQDSDYGGSHGRSLCRSHCRRRGTYLYYQALVDALSDGICTAMPNEHHRVHGAGKQ